jgi:hypothetical protein
VASRNATHVSMMQPCWRNLVHKACGQGAKGPPSLMTRKGYEVAGLGSPMGGIGYVENVGASAEMEPGDWALDGTSVYYALREGESGRGLVGVLPTVSVLVNVSSGARDVSFVNVTFEHSTWLRPGEADGYVEQQTGCGAIGTNFSFNSDCAIDTLWSVKSPGSVVVRDAANISFVDCEFARLGGFGLDLTRAVGCVVDGG